MESTQEIEKVKEGYKKTVVGLIPEDWTCKSLREIGELKNGINKDKSDFGFGLPMINLMDVFGYNRLFKNNLDLSLVNATERDLKEFSLEKGDVLFIRSSVKSEGVGLTALICDDLQNTTYSGFIIRFRDNNFLNFDFKAHCFYESNFRQRLMNKSTISANTNINQSALNSLILAIPPLPEQQKIATILSTWDEAISKQKILVEQTRKRNQGIAQQLLTGKKRLKGFDGAWKEMKFGDAISRITRRNDIENTNVVTISAKRGFVRQDDFFNKQVASETLTNYYLLKKGEFAYNKSYSNGYPMGAFKRLNDFDFGVVTTLYICFSVKNEFDSNFFMHFFEAGLMTHGLTKIAQEGGRAHGLLNIGLNDFLSLKIIVPNLQEQKVISQLIEIAELELKLQKQQLSSLQNEKEGLMQKLLTGEIRVNVKN